MEMCSGPLGPGAASGQFQFVLQSTPGLPFLPGGYAIAQSSQGLSVACSVAQQQTQQLLTNSTAIVSSTTNHTSSGLAPIQTSASAPKTIQPIPNQLPQSKRLAPRSIMPRPLAPKVATVAPQPSPPPQPPSMPVQPQQPVHPVASTAFAVPTTALLDSVCGQQQHALTRPASCTFQAFQFATPQMIPTAAIFAPGGGGGSGGVFFSASDAIGALGGGQTYYVDSSALSGIVPASVGPVGVKAKKSKKKAPARQTSVLAAVSKPHPLCHSLSDSNLLRRTESSHQSPGGRDLLLMACEEAGLHLADEMSNPATMPQPQPSPSPLSKPEQVPNVDSSVEAAADTNDNDNSLLTELGLLEEQPSKLQEQICKAPGSCDTALSAEEPAASDAASVAHKEDRPSTPAAEADDSLLLKLFDQPLTGSGCVAPADDAAALPMKPDSSGVLLGVAVKDDPECKIEHSVIIVDDSIVEVADVVESAEKLLFSDSFVESWHDCLQFATLEAPPPLPPQQPPLPPPLLEPQLASGSPMAEQISSHSAAPAPTCNRVLSETLQDRPASPLPPVLHPESAEAVTSDFLESLNPHGTDLADCWSSDLPAGPMDIVEVVDGASAGPVGSDMAGNDVGNVSNCQSLLLDDFFELNTATTPACSAGCSGVDGGCCSQPASNNCQPSSESAAVADVPPPLLEAAVTIHESHPDSKTLQQQPQQRQDSPPSPQKLPTMQPDILNTPTAAAVLTATMACNYAPSAQPPDPQQLAQLRNCPPLQFPPSPPPPRLTSPITRASSASTVPAVDAAADADVGNDCDEIGNRTLTAGQNVVRDDDGPMPVLSPAPLDQSPPPPPVVLLPTVSRSPMAYSPISEPASESEEARAYSSQSHSMFSAAPPSAAIASVSASTASTMAPPPSASSDQCPPSTRPSSTFVDDDEDVTVDESDSCCVESPPLIDTLVKAMLSATESLEASGTAAAQPVVEEALPPSLPPRMLPVLRVETDAAPSSSPISSPSSASGDLSAPSLACLARQIFQSATEAAAAVAAVTTEELEWGVGYSSEMAPPQLDRIVQFEHSQQVWASQPPRLSKAALKCNYEKPRQFDLAPPPPPQSPVQLLSSPLKRASTSAYSAPVAKHSPKKPLKLQLKEKRRAMAAAVATTSPTKQCQQQDHQPIPAAVSTPVRPIRIKILPIRSPKKASVSDNSAAPSTATTAAGPSTSAGSGLKIRLNLKSLGLTSAAGPSPSTPPQPPPAEPSVESAGSSRGYKKGKNKRRTVIAEPPVPALNAEAIDDDKADEVTLKPVVKKASKRKSNGGSGVRRKSAAAAAAPAEHKKSRDGPKRSRLSVEDCGVSSVDNEPIGTIVRERLTLRLPLRHSWEPPPAMD